MKLDEGRLRSVRVIRGAPCDATWIAAEKLAGTDLDDAPRAFGLAVQMACVADPSGWDPIHGRSPVHFAGKVHRAALERAIRRALREQELRSLR